jgi:hypothetical protein
MVFVAFWLTRLHSVGLRSVMYCTSSTSEAALHCLRLGVLPYQSTFRGSMRGIQRISWSLLIS